MAKILIFEDNEHFRETYVTMCTASGLEVVAYENPGSEPVATVVRENPDIISMDINMPVMNGFEAGRRIKADPRTKRIPLFFLTTLGLAEDREQGRTLGAIDYLVKGESAPEDVVKRVKELLGLTNDIGQTN